LNLGDPDDPRLTCVEVQVEDGVLTEEIMKTRDVKMRDSRGIPDMGKARFVRMRRGVFRVIGTPTRPPLYGIQGRKRF